MTKAILAALTVCALASPAFAGSYPLQGKWGESKTADKNPIDCTKLRVIAFDDDQRTDTAGGVPAYRNFSVTPDGPKNWKVVDRFTNGQVRDGRVYYTLQRIDDTHAEMKLQTGGSIKLQRCK
jgi:hypothetical protein